MNYRALGKNIRKYRQEKELNQEELAELVGCTSSHIGQIENARGIPSLEMTVRIANALCVSIDLLVLESLQHPEIAHLHDIEKQLKQFPASTKHAVCTMIRDLINLVGKFPGSQSADNYSAYDFHI